MHEIDIMDIGGFKIGQAEDTPLTHFLVLW